ncbi:GIY-YIG_SF superfamily protein [Psychroflexus torquis ATCC 700755]|uniref:GIY-YIG_SF superfamily protein n=1 Tax=Psychroflexus torquis (strain ATCC 700755 / CIP 106069 / ACAM 623) TaxID=313595 RepID=K4IJK9_PSYTT|nr:GIY-YIG nuclease family protein [Psychroflexus torquis]AFU69301.1 GIY-YIG_SF superfamily protein [Psychroflexus torquis ATCC 700755]
MKIYYVYILKCSDDSFYTGMTNDLERRFEEHRYGHNKLAYTFNKRPLELKFFETFNDVDQAFYFERKIKKWSKAKKQALIDQNWDRLKDLSICRNDTHYSNKK